MPNPLRLSSLFISQSSMDIWLVIVSYSLYDLKFRLFQTSLYLPTSTKYTSSQVWLRTTVDLYKDLREHVYYYSTFLGKQMWSSIRRSINTLVGSLHTNLRLILLRELSQRYPFSYSQIRLNRLSLRLIQASRLLGTYLSNEIPLLIRYVLLRSIAISYLLQRSITLFMKRNCSLLNTLYRSSISISTMDIPLSSLLITKV